MNQPGTNMAGMGAMAGGPGNMTSMQPMGNVSQDPHKQLNTYIYDYLLKNRHYDLARTFQKSVDVDTRKATKQSPGRREVNGIDDSMDGDSKDDPARPDDLPDANVPVPSVNDHSFLFDWWCQFWDVFAAQRRKPLSANGNPQTAQYLAMSKTNAQLRNDRSSHMINATNANMMRGVPANAQQQMEMQKRMNMTTLNPAQRQAMQQAQQQKMLANGMQRDGSGMNMGDQRPQSPATAENAPSPSKRPRLEGNGNFGNQMGSGGRTQPMPGNPMGATAGPGGNQMMMNGMAPNDMPAQFGFNGQGGPGQQKAMEGMNPNGGPQAGQMVNQGMDQQSDIFTGNTAGGRGMPGGPGAPGGPQQPGNHALQDYQMQLMLLEQQNKKRLLMARQEQDNIVQPHGPGVAQPGFPGQAPSMSPQGSRAGPSPNPADQMKRGTPKLGGNAGLPGSPMPDGSMQGNRASPIPNGAAFDPSQMPAGMPPQYPYANGPPMNPSNMRPPSSHPNAGFGGAPLSQQQIEVMQRARQQGQPMPGQFFQGGQQMMPNAGQPPQNMGTHQQRAAAMPPPPAPQAGGEQRTQPPSPQQNANAPPTPQQGNKAAPKKKEKADNKKKAPAKKNSTAAQGATPASDPDPPPTPTPSTPITPMHPQSFKNGQQGQNNPNQPPNAPAVQQIQQPQMDPGPNFGLEGNDPGMDIQFASLDGSDVLQDFDFDSFLHTENDNGFGAFDANFGFPADGVEATESLG